jgi:predicted Rossmann fold nucleotide-binding protein DprA/Smf involved in DNA uptake
LQEFLILSPAELSHIVARDYQVSELLASAERTLLKTCALEKSCFITQILKNTPCSTPQMTDLSKEEKDVLKALGELEPATIEEIARKTNLTSAAVQKVLAELEKKGLLDSVDPNSAD